MPDTHPVSAHPEHQNFVAGAWQASCDAGRFVVRDGTARERVLGSWPRSNASELAVVAEVWSREPLGWPLAERRATCERAALSLESDVEGGALCAAILGLEAHEWGLHTSGLCDALPEEPPRSAAPGGISVLAPHWSELARGLWRAVARELLEGRRVLLLADERLPASADLVVRALLREGLPPDALALLHGASDQVEPALALPGVRSLVASGPAGRLRALRRAAAQSGTEERLETLRSGAREIDAHEDLEAAAHEIAGRAFGRARALSGQLHGQLARVHCPERRFSAFTGALLAALDASPDVARPLAFLSDEESAAAQRLRALGLDEGATLIFGAALRDAERPGRANPAVFTNVEPFMDCARQDEPAPVLRLLRVPGNVR